jgi:alkyl hydroperoxide reductase subunit AhpF
MPANLLNDDIVKQIQELFNGQLVHPVEMIYFSTPEACESCEDTRQLLEEISSLSDNLYLSMHNFNENTDLATQYQVERAPGLVIAARDPDKLTDFGIKFSGIPSGYEFSSLIHAILMVSKRDSGLKPELREELKNLVEPVNLKVFVTPT